MTQHLDEATLALLADHAGTDAEALHLATCSDCSRRVDEYRQMAGALRSLPDLTAPSAVRDRVLSSGVRSGVVAMPSPRRRVWVQAGVGIAAAFLLFVGGYSLGRSRSVTSGTPPVAQTTVVDAVARDASPEVVLTARAAALEALTLTAEAALKDAPTDPVILEHYRLVRHDRDMLRQRVQIVNRPAHWF
jgi:anti-sigma factor RsiW